MKNVLFIIQEEKPIRFASSLHELVATQISSFGGSSSAFPQSHRSNSTTYTMLDALNIQVKEEDTADLQDLLCFGIHMDESTDISQQKCLLIYVQYMDQRELRPVQKFLTALKLGDTTAAGIVQSVLTYFQKIGVDLRKLVMFTSDGAAVMLGCKGGVAQLLRLQLDLPHLVEFHCVAHREALAMKDAYRHNRFFLNFEHQISELITYLQTHKHIRQLRIIAEALELEFLQFSRIFEIRWLSRYMVVSKLVLNLPVVQPTLADLSNSDPIAMGFYKMVSSEQFLLTLFFLADILQPLAFLNKQFQVRNFHPFDIARIVNACTGQLEAAFLGSKLKPGTNVQKLLELLDSKALVTEEPQSRAVFDKVKKEVIGLVGDIVQALKDRLLRDSALFRNAKIFDPGNSENLNVDDFHQFGQEEIRFLATHFASFGLSDMDIAEEWNQLKYEFLSPTVSNRVTSWTDILKRCFQEEMFPNLSVLAEILLCFCAENAEVERGFSLYTRLKSKTRNRLKIGTIDLLMRLRLNATGYNSFDYNRASVVWFGMAERGRYNVGWQQDMQQQVQVTGREDVSIGGALAAQDDEEMAAIEERAADYEDYEEELEEWDEEIID